MSTLTIAAHHTGPPSQTVDAKDRLRRYSHGELKLVTEQKYFLTFGDGSWELRAAARRITREARATGLFDDTCRYDYSTLQRKFPEFWEKNAKFILNNSRGGGYWLWKPFIIFQTLNKIPEDSILLYCDAGCEIDSRLRLNIDQINPKLNKSDITLFEIEGHSIKDWTNEFTLTRLSAAKPLRELSQFAATIIFCRNNKNCRNLIISWLDKCLSDDYQLLVDRQDKESPSFREHRHDQSILSILTRQFIFKKKIRLKIISWNFFETDGSGVLARRNKSGYRFETHRDLRVRIIRKLERRAQSILNLETRYRRNLITRGPE